MTVRTRFAPSPTGYLHIGGVRTALFGWLFAKGNGGKFILRIDDTDQQRNVEEALQPILDGLRWLGLEWDEGPEVDGPFAPYYQSRRVANHKAAAEKLLEAGLAYRDYAKTEEIQAEREAAMSEKRPFVYSRSWMAETREQQAKFEAEGRQGVVRLKMPREGKLVIDDLVRGPVEFAWAGEQDHVIQRADGSCLYHLASVVDDHDMEITHVIRAEEHLSNTPRQIFIAQGLEYELPRYAHLPYVAAPGGKAKLSKRKLKQYLKNADFAKMLKHGQQIADAIGLQTNADTFNPVIVDFYEKVGYVPEAIINYLALLGWSLDDKTEQFSRDELVEHFSLDRVNRAPASFDCQKLMAFQDRHMQALPLDERTELVTPLLYDARLLEWIYPCQVDGFVSHILEICGDRIKVAGDIFTYAKFFFVSDDELEYDEKAFDKRLRKPPEAVELLKKFRQRVDDARSFEPADLEKMMHDFVESEGIRIGQIIHAVRVAITGQAIGPGMFDCMEIFGRQRCLDRIDRAMERV